MKALLSTAIVLLTASICLAQLYQPEFRKISDPVLDQIPTIQIQTLQLHSLQSALDWMENGTKNQIKSMAIRQSQYPNFYTGLYHENYYQTWYDFTYDKETMSRGKIIMTSLYYTDLPSINDWSGRRNQFQQSEASLSFDFADFDAARSQLIEIKEGTNLGELVMEHSLFAVTFKINDDKKLISAPGRDAQSSFTLYFKDYYLAAKFSANFNLVVEICQDINAN